VYAKFGSVWGGCSIDPPGPHGVGLWKNIMDIVSFVFILDLSWEVGQRSNFGIMCGAKR
jgi:hypothetical protein